MADLHFPLFLDLHGKRVAVIGGGQIALRRVTTLRRFGAAISVTAPEICEELAALPDVALHRRPYNASDVADAVLVLAATNDPGLNRSITADARAAGALANNASDRADSDFYFPAIALGDGLCAGICGTGEDHRAVARAAAAVRQALAAQRTCEEENT